MNEPPVIPAEPAANPKGGLGRVGLLLSLAALAALVLMWLSKPG